MLHRLEKMRAAMAEADCEAFVSFNAPANEYLTGFRGSTSAVLITANAARFLSDFRYAEQAESQVEGYEIHVVKGTLETRAGEHLFAMKASKVAFDPQVTTVYQAEKFSEAFNGIVEPAGDLVRALRWIKDDEEIARLRDANDLAEEVLHEVLQELRPGMLEWELSAQIEYQFKVRGAQGPSFEPIVLFGARSSLPHGVPGDKALETGDIVLIDMGCIHRSYCSDLTRTYAFGRIPGTWFEEIYEITLEAQRAATEAVCSGALGKEVDAAARDIIAEAGYGEFFGHGLGHGVGLEVHEAPRMNMQSETALAPGMAVTIEPGIYLPGQGGVRIEDLVVVTEYGCDVLTKSAKELKVLGL